MAQSGEQAELLLESVRRLSPSQLLRLAGLWAGVSHGSLDPHRQRRRNGARIALRYIASEDGDHSADIRSTAAAEAVAAAFASQDPKAARSLRGPAADATFAVADALDALAYSGRLSRVAFDELMRPWKVLSKDLAFENQGRGANDRPAPRGA